MVEAYLVLPDWHIPYHCRHSYFIVTKLIQLIPNLKGFIQLGDMVELESVSRWQRGKDSYHYFAKEREAAIKYLAEFRSLAPTLSFHCILGNHEARLEKYIFGNAPALEGSIDIGVQLRFQEMGITHTPYTHNQLCRFKDTDLFLRHEPLNNGRMSAKGTAELGGVNLIYGHTHTYQKYTHKNLLGKINIARSLGWIGDENKSCFTYRGAKDTWSKNIGVIYYEQSTKKYYIEEFDLNQNEIFYRGKIIKS